MEQNNEEFKYVIVNRLKLKHFIDIFYLCKTCWDWEGWGKEDGNFVLNLSVMCSLTNKNNRMYNAAVLCVDKNDKCIGYNLYYNGNKREKYHPFMYITNIICYIFLYFSKHGKDLVKKKKTNTNFLYYMTYSGRYLLARENYHKISVGILTMVSKEYRGRGIYKYMSDLVFKSINGKFLIYTNTHADYKAHEKTGFEYLLSVENKANKESVFIMYKDISHD